MTLTNIKERLALQLPSPLIKVDPRELDIHVPNDISLWLKQDNAIHPIISGNKWRKLAPTIVQYLTSQQELPQQIISFGGGYSNHLHALGYICKIFNIEFHAFIRGNYAQRLTPCLADLYEWGTTFHWLTKIQYKQRHQSPYLSALQTEYPQALIIPEGGSNEHAPIGVAQCIQEIVTQLKQVSHNTQGTIKPILQQRHVIVTPVATAATLAGLIYGIAEQKESCPHLNIDILGIAVLKSHPKEAPDYLESLTNKHLSQLIATQHLDKSCIPNWTINHAYHAGGYAKTTPELLEFCTKINTHQNKLEPTYSGKVAFAIKQLIENQVLLNYDNIIMLHTGGLQGLRKS